LVVFFELLNAFGIFDFRDVYFRSIDDNHPHDKEKCKDTHVDLTKTIYIINLIINEKNWSYWNLLVDRFVCKITWINSSSHYGLFFDL
jgi:hypothetical protein